MSEYKVFITRRIPEAGLTLLPRECDADIWPLDIPPTKAELMQHVKGTHGILCLLSDAMDAVVMDAAGDGLKVISTYAVGFDNIDIPQATRRGIAVGNTPGVLTDATADFAFSLLMAAARRVVEAHNSVQAGTWKTWGPSTLLGADMAGSTLGLIGFGRIGQAVARRAQGFGMRVLFHDPHITQTPSDVKAEPVSLEELLRQSDFVSLHAPLNALTRAMINTDTLAQMKPGAILVNTARGALVDQQALFDALKSRRLAYAALDVTEPEPLPMESPLLSLDNLIITPHIASASHSTRDRMAVMAVQNLVAGLQGKRLPWCVNPEIYA